MRKYVFLFFITLFFIFSSYAETMKSVILSTLYPYKYSKYLKFTDLYLDELLKGEKSNIFFSGEYFNELKADENYSFFVYSDFFKTHNKEGFSFLNEAYLYDTDIFYGRDGFPEGKLTPLLKGNDYNRTLNNELFTPDDYILRKSHILDKLHLFYKKSSNNMVFSTSFIFYSGENFNSDGSGVSFENAKLIYKNNWEFSAGKISPFFDEYTFDKKYTKITGFEVRNRDFYGIDIDFVAARPDVPLDFTKSSPNEAMINLKKWNGERDIIYHFEKPYNFFYTKKNELPVYVYAYHTDSSGTVVTDDITNLCKINYDSVIIPADIISPMFDYITIKYDEIADKGRQLNYLNAFNIKIPIRRGTSFFVSYVNLHNDTHSIEDISGVVGPLDSHLWNFILKSKLKHLSLFLQYAESAMVPNDYRFNKREIDAIYWGEISYYNDFLKLTGAYYWLGADYMPNILSLRDKWKLFEDKNGNYKWDYEEARESFGNEVYKFSVKFNRYVGLNIPYLDLRLDDVKFSYRHSKNLVSNYLRNVNYASSEDKFYIPYYSSVGNGYKLYGDGIDDGMETDSYSIGYYGKETLFEYSYKKVEDDNLIITDLKKDYNIRKLLLKAKFDEDSYLFWSKEWKENFVWYSPIKNNFEYQKSDKTTRFGLHMNLPLNVYNNNYSLVPDFLGIAFSLDLDYTYDADSLFLDKENYIFKEYIKDIDVVDQDIFKNGVGIYLYYKIKPKNYFLFTWKYDKFIGVNSVDNDALDYKKWERGVKYFSNFGLKNARVVAFYDEYELRFEHLSGHDYSFKRIGGYLQYEF